jgi:hypothetical protein
VKKVRNHHDRRERATASKRGYQFSHNSSAPREPDASLHFVILLSIEQILEITLSPERARCPQKVRGRSEGTGERYRGVDSTIRANVCPHSRGSSSSFESGVLQKQAPKGSDSDRDGADRQTAGTTAMKKRFPMSATGKRDVQWSVSSSNGNSGWYISAGALSNSP